MAAGILEDSDGRILITERLGDGPFHGMWEFPGGKIGDDETADEALARELLEEIGISVIDAERFQSLDHTYPDRRVSIDFFLVPEWDGEPLEPEEPKGPRTPPTGPEPGPEEPPGGGEGPEPPQEKIVVKLSDGSVRRIKYIASTTYWSPEGKPISAQEFLERLFGDLAGIVADEDQLRAVWSDPDNRERFLEQLSDRGYDRDRLDDIRRLVDAPDSDLFDVLSYILFTNPPKTRNERADNVRKEGLRQTAEETKALLLAILAAYEERGESELRTKKLGTFLTARYGSVSEGKARLGGLDAIKTAFRDMQGTLYSD